MKSIKAVFFCDSYQYTGTSSNEGFLKFLSPILNSLRKNMTLQEIWIVSHGGSTSKVFHDGINTYNVFNFKNGKELLEKLEPDILLMTSSEYICYSLMLAAKKLDIPSVFLDSGILYSTEKSSFSNTLQKRFTQICYSGNDFIKKYFFLLKTQLTLGFKFKNILKVFFQILSQLLSSINRIEVRPNADSYICSNYDWADDAIKKGVNPENIFVVGELLLDPLYERLTTLTKNTSGKIEILFITTSVVEHGIWTSDMRKKLVIDVVNELYKIKNISNLRIKIHPGESEEYYRQLTHQIYPDIEIIRLGDLTNLIFQSDLVVTFAQSSALIEALLFERPIIIVNMFNENYPFIKEGIVIECKNGEETRKKIVDGSYKKIDKMKLSKFKERKFFKFDGNCGKRAAEQIIKVLQKSEDRKKS
jgi:UDP-N-acetylglucosamine:LPS N-acetylglucosamine transferase